MVFDITDRVEEARAYFDNLLDDRIAKISELSGVPAEQMIKFNPAQFLERNRFQTIRGYHYTRAKDFINKNKRDDTYLISPLDAIQETAEQIGYKEAKTVERTFRASKLKIVPVPAELCKDFFIRNHRQSVPPVRKTAVAFGLAYGEELVAVMLYDITNGAIRGRNNDYELLRLSIARRTKIYGGASKLQAACEETLRQMGCSYIYSYSNATINNGGVYKALGFTGKKIESGQPHVITRDNRIVRLITLYPNSTDEALALRGQMKFHLGGNRVWHKKI